MGNRLFFFLWALRYVHTVLQQIILKLKKGSKQISIFTRPLSQPPLQAGGLPQEKRLLQVASVKMEGAPVARLRVGDTRQACWQAAPLGNMHRRKTIALPVLLVASGSWGPWTGESVSARVTDFWATATQRSISKPPSAWASKACVTGGEAHSSCVTILH